MKLKTNKLLTLTLASSLVAITACGGGGTKAAAPTGGSGPTNPDPVTYAEWAAGTTVVAVDTDNAFLAGVAATSTTEVTLTGVTSGATVETLNLAYEVTAESDTVTSGGTTTKGLNAETFGGAATNGVAFATNGAAADADLRYFAGVIAGANVGVPLTTTTAAGTWNGIFQAVGANAVERDFELNVNFDDSQVSAIVPLTGDDASVDGIMSYFFVGNFAAGVITGDIIFGDFGTGNADEAAAIVDATSDLTAAVAPDAASPATDGVGTLSGLIGANGALGAFYSTANGADGYAGGFVALTAENVGGDDPDVVYADWAAGATQAAGITANAFLVGTATGLTGEPNGAAVETLNLNELITDAGTGTAGTPAVPTAVQGTTGSRLGGSALNGVAFFTTGATTEARYFAGLHNTTDLGAPISAAPTTAIWNGLFQAVGAGDYATAAKAFALTVTYSATADSTIIGLVGANNNADAFTAAGTSYYISGTYNADGVITGSVLYRDFSAATSDALARTAAAGLLTTATADGAASPATDGLGVLSGLIGANGAVGAFYSNAEDATDGYAGGFVVSTTANADIAPVAVVDYVVDHAKWDVTPIPALTANGFLTSSGTDVLTFTDLTAPVTQVKVDLSAGAGGVTYFETVDGAAAFYKAGIHADTTLGAPVTAATVTGVWSGVFGAVGNAEHDTPNTTAITLTVAFGSTDAARTIVGLVPANDNTNVYGVDGETSYYISGTYNAAGVISGNVLYGDFATGNVDRPAALIDAASDFTTATASTATGAATNGVGTLTGLIGQSGAVGAFYSSGNDGTAATGYAGGFAVTRTPPSGS